MASRNPGKFVTLALVVIVIVAAAAYLFRSPPTTSTKSADAVSGPPIIAVPDPADTTLSMDRARALIQARLETLQPGGVVVIGDSIVARSGVSEMCGRPALKGGLPGARVRDWDEFGPELLAKARPALVVFALGINDAPTNFETDPAEWARMYARLIDSATPAKVALLSIMPVEPARLNNLTIPASSIARLNTELAKLAAAKGALLLPPLPNLDGMSVDGVHLNELGQRRWAAQLAQACVALP